MSRAAILYTSAFALGAIVLPAVKAPAPALLWNLTPSGPLGLYRVSPGAAVAVGDWVAVWPPAPLRSLFAARNYLPATVPLVKRVAATTGRRVCRSGAKITIDGRAIAMALARDRHDRPLPFWRGCRRLGPHEVFLLNPAPASLDGRYFGPVSTRLIVGRLTPIWITGASK